MNTQEWLDDIEDTLRVTGVKFSGDRWDLLNIASAELTTLSGQIDHDCFHVRLDPIIYTTDGSREYDLPDNFGINFAKGAGDQGDKFCCLIDDGTSESLLDFQSNVQFYGNSLTSESSGVPSKYTIISAPNGRKRLVLSPPPDDDYEIDGLYKPTDWDLKTMDSIPPLPGNSPVLKFAVLKRIRPDIWGGEYEKALAALYLELARGRVVTFKPSLGRNRNSYTLM